MSLVSLCACNNWPSVLLSLSTTPPNSPSLSTTFGPASWTPLHFACASPETPSSVLTTLLSLGADVHARGSSGSTPLHLSAWHGVSSSVTVLLSAGASVDARTSAGRTSAHFAARRGHVDVLRTLASHGADLTLADDNGKTPVHLAKEAGFSNVAREIVEEAAQSDHAAESKARKEEGEVRGAESGSGSGSSGWGLEEKVRGVTHGVGGLVRAAWKSSGAVAGPNKGNELRGVRREMNTETLADVMAAYVGKGVSEDVARRYGDIVTRGVVEYRLTPEVLLGDRPTAEVLVAELLQAAGVEQVDGGALFYTLVNFVEAARRAQEAVLVKRGVLRNENGAVRKEVYAALGAGVLFSMLVPLTRRAGSSG